MAGTINKITERVEDLGEKAKGGAQQMGDKAKDMAHEISDKAGDVASKVADRARDFTKAVSEKASEVAGAVGQKVEDATANVGSGLKTMADKVREKAPHNGILGSAAGSVADGIERTGDYLREEGLSGMSKDVAALVRTHPIPALLLGVGLGFLLARATKS